MKNKKAKSKIFHYNFFPKSRKAAMEIVLLVFLVFLVVTVALFIFLVNPSYAKVNVYDARFIENVYQRQDLIEFYIRQVGEDVLEKTGESDFKENFKAEFGRYNFAPQAYPETFPDEMSTGSKGDYLEELEKIIQEDKFNVFIVDKILEIRINGWEIEDSFGKIQIIYTPEISVKFDLKN